MAMEAIFGENTKVFVGGTEYSTEVTKVSISGGQRTIQKIETVDGTVILKKTSPTLLSVEIEFIKRDVDLAVYVFGGSGNTITESGKRAENVTVGLLAAEDDFGTSGRVQLKFSNCIGITIRNEMTADDVMREFITFNCKASDYEQRYSASASWTTLQ
jgi:hypothetical protein